MTMEFDFPLTFILVVSSVFILIKLLHKPDKPSLLLNRIPGPRKLPVIGNLHLLAGESPPHHVFRDLAAKYGPLMRLQLGGVPFLVVSSVELAKQVLKTHDAAFANRPPVHAIRKMTYNNADIGSGPSGEYWRQLRRLCTHELLGMRRVKSFRPEREEVNSDLAKWIASNEGSPVNLSERLFQFSFDVMARTVIGKESTEKQAILAAMDDFLKLSTGLSIADLYPSNRLLPVITGLNFRIRRVFQQTDKTLQRIVNEHKAVKAAAAAMKRSEDLVDVLLKYQEGDDDGLHLTNDNVKAVILNMFMAGSETSAKVVDWTSETSAKVVDWAMSEMVRNPTILRVAQDEVRQVFDGKGYVDEENFEELKYLKLVIKETLRMHSPGPILFPRINSESCEINGYEIPANTRVVVNAWALGRDPKYWNDPEKFIPKRFEDGSIDFKGKNLEYIPFGAGKRMCPGISFGVANVEVFLATLLYHFDWEMPNGMRNEELDMTEDFVFSLRRKQDLVLIPTLKRPIVL